MRKEEPKVPLDALDPERKDPGYWLRLQRRIVSSARLELARRRRLHDLTVTDVVLSWSRAVVGTALVAAAVAALLMVQSDSATPPAVTAVEAVTGVEEALLGGLDRETANVFLTADESSDFTSFASVEGF